jgi:hypothetical protein
MMNISPLARANDGFGELGLGGIALEKTNDIAMHKEVLEIGYKKIKVAYEFVNESDQDITTTVSFPLPRYPAFPFEPGIITSGEPPGFDVIVDSKPVRFQTRIEASSNGKDITRQLKALGLSEFNIANMPFAIDKQLKEQDVLHGILDSDQQQQLTRFGLMKDGLPAWEVQVIYHWQQKFPARSTLNISHQYTPFTAGGTTSAYERGRFIESGNAARFCTDKETIKRLDKLAADEKQQDAYGMLSGTIVKYILLTANTWKDGVRDFTLRINKERQDEIISLCFPGNFRRVNATTLESKISNFPPSSDLEIYFGNIDKNTDTATRATPPRLQR